MTFFISIIIFENYFLFLSIFRKFIIIKNHKSWSNFDHDKGLLWPGFRSNYWSFIQSGRMEINQDAGLIRPGFRSNYGPFFQSDRMDIDHDARLNSTRILLELWANFLVWSNENRPGYKARFDQDSDWNMGQFVPRFF